MPGKLPAELPAELPANDVATGPAGPRWRLRVAMRSPPDDSNHSAELGASSWLPITESSRSLSWSCEPGIAVNTNKDWD